MTLFRNKNWGLRFLALVLAIVIYYALSNNSSRQEGIHERTIFHHN